MRNDTPAAPPLIAYAAALACGASLAQPRFAACALVVLALLVGLRRPRAAAAILAAAAGIAMSLRLAHTRESEQRAVAAFERDRFVVVEAPLDRGWSRRETSSLLRVARFRANGREFAQPLLIYTRSTPPPIGMSATIRAEGFVRVDDRGDFVMTIKSPRLMAYRGELLRWNPARWNRALAARLAPYAVVWPEEVALAEALALGRGERLGDAMRDEYRRGGTYHLLVFSGMQIAIAAAAIAWLLRWLHAPRASDWSLLAFAVLAPAFIGPTASVMRASIAIGLYALSRILKRPTSIGNLWCVSALIRLLLAPAELTDAGFQLTYVGAGALLFLTHPKSRRSVRLATGAIAAEAAITPLTLFHFHQYAIAGSISTIAMSPVIFAMLLVSAAACALPCDAIFGVMHLLRDLCSLMNAGASPLSGFLARPPALVVIGAFAAAWLLRRRPALAIAALLVPSVVAAWPRGGPAITILDIGQGDSILVRDAGHVLLVDGGPSPDVLLPLLADRGVRRIDVVLLTHAHPDHCGGLPAVVRRLKVGEVWISPRRFRGPCAQELLAACSERATPIHLVRDGDARNLGAVRISALLAGRTFRRSPENNSSIVVRLQIERRRVLLTGDVEREAEAMLAERVRRADILKVAHHGSHTSSTALLLDAVAPRVAFISCGRHNLFGHPHAEVLAALEARRVRVWRTDRSGSIEIALDGGRLAVRPQIDTPPPRL